MEENVKWLFIIGAVVLCIGVVLLVATLLCRSRCRQRRSRRCVRDSSISWQPISRAPSKGAVVQTPLIMKTGAQIAALQQISKTLPRVDQYDINDLKHSSAAQQFSTRSMNDLGGVPYSARVTKPVPVQLSKRRRPPSGGSVSSRDKGEDPELKESQLQCASDLAELTRKSFASAGPTPEFLAEDWSTPTRQPTVEFSVTYVSSSKAFVVHVTRIINLSIKPRKSSTSVKIKLVRFAGGCPTVQSSADSPASGAAAVVVDSSKHAFDAEKGTYYAFSGHNQEDLRQYSLRLSVYEGKFKNLREKRLGVVEYSLAQLELGCDVPVTCIQKLLTSKTDKQKTKDDKLLDENSQLMLSLFYQTSANRIKVLIRKAANLPKKKRRLGQPEFYVVVNAVSCGNVMATRETKSVPGRSPVWNEPFIFDLPEKDVDKYFLQFVVMSGKLCRQDGIVGQVIVGPDVRGPGRAHWHEAFEPRAIEAVKWHKLQPL